MSIIMNFVTRRIVFLVQFLIRVFKRALCCFRRRRRSSCDAAPLTTIDIISDGQVVETQSWGSWEEPASVAESDPSVNQIQEQIRMYRQQRSSLSQVEEEIEPPVDFFLEMTPRITRQTKVLLKDKTDTQQSNHFSLDADPVFNSSELGVWEENQTWEAQADDDVNVTDVLREQKRQERERRMMEQQRRKNERGRQLTATKPRRPI